MLARKYAHLPDPLNPERIGRRYFRTLCGRRVTVAAFLSLTPLCPRCVVEQLINTTTTPEETAQ